MCQRCVFITSTPVDLCKVEVEDDEQNVGGCVQDARSLHRNVKEDEGHRVGVAAILPYDEEDYVEEAGHDHQNVNADVYYIQSIY